MTAAVGAGFFVGGCSGGFEVADASLACSLCFVSEFADSFLGFAFLFATVGCAEALIARCGFEGFEAVMALSGLHVVTRFLRSKRVDWLRFSYPALATLG